MTHLNNLPVLKDPKRKQRQIEQLDLWKDRVIIRRDEFQMTCRAIEEERAEEADPKEAEEEADPKKRPATSEPPGVMLKRPAKKAGPDGAASEASSEKAD